MSSEIQCGEAGGKDTFRKNKKATHFQHGHIWLGGSREIDDYLTRISPKPDLSDIFRGDEQTGAVSTELRASTRFSLTSPQGS